MPKAQFEVKVENKVVNNRWIHQLHVESDLDQPDHCVVELSNLSEKDDPALGGKVHSEWLDVGHKLEVAMGLNKDRGDTIQKRVFIGEIVGIEPTFSQRLGLTHRVNVRAFNPLHVMTRGPNTTHPNDTDAAIIKNLCSPYHITPRFKPGVEMPDTKHLRYQNNESDLDFLRRLAAYNGLDFVCGQDPENPDDKTVYLDLFRRNDEPSGIKLKMNSVSEPGEILLEHFHPRLSTAFQVSKVVVRGWDPKTKKPIQGVAPRQSRTGSDLGGTSGSAATEQTHPKVNAIAVDVAVYSVAEAERIADAILSERAMGFITGSGSCEGSPLLKPGLVVDVDLGSKHFPRFSPGKYYLTSVTHHWAHHGEEGYQTDFKFQRDAHDSTEKGAQNDPNADDPS
jgi:phage protein D